MSDIVFGTVLNVIAILLGAVVGWLTPWQPPVPFQQWLRVVLGAFTVFFGFQGVWQASAGTTWARMFGQVLLAVLALVIGRAIGRGLGVQRNLNGVGREARALLATAGQGARPTFGRAFVACSGLFCLTPLALIGAVQDGLKDDFHLLAVKAVMEGLAAMAMVRALGWGTALSALAVLAFQGTVSLALRAAAPSLSAHSVADMLSVTAGFLATFVALLILEIHTMTHSKPVEVADYLPGLFVAPALAWLFL